MYASPSSVLYRERRGVPAASAPNLLYNRIRESHAAWPSGPDDALVRYNTLPSPHVASTCPKPPHQHAETVFLG